MTRLPFPLRLALAAALHAACAPEPAPERPHRAVRVMVVPDASDIQRAPLPGRAEAVEALDLGFEVAGRMLERPVGVGDRIAEGQVLAQLDLRDFQAELQRTSAARDRAREQFRRVVQAAKTGAVSAQDVTDAEADYEETEAAVAIRAKDLEDATLRAPFDGVVSATYVESFQEVAVREPILRLLDTSRIEMWVDLPEYALALLPYVAGVTVHFDALPGRAFPARVAHVGREADDETRTFPVSLLIEQPEDRALLPGMAGSLEFELRPDTPQLEGVMVPLSSVYSDRDGSFVWVLDAAGGAVARREVRADHLTDVGILVRHGLAPGEKLVVEGGHFLQDGQAVRVVEDPGAAS